MYFNVYFKEMKIGAQQGGLVGTEQLCAAGAGTGETRRHRTQRCGLPVVLGNAQKPPGSGSAPLSSERDQTAGKVQGLFLEVKDPEQSVAGGCPC